MAKRRIHGSRNEAQRKLTKTGNYTYYVTIPKALIDELEWQERQLVTVKRVGSKLMISRGR
ncbi:MAG: hypothetical protein O3A51_04040 [Verrucomicrobia bacterium]|nr:hypothetical protein [Verrucomicrobiota bacterium]